MWAYFGPIAAVVFFWLFFSDSLTKVVCALERIADALESKNTENNGNKNEQQF